MRTTLLRPLFIFAVLIGSMQAALAQPAPDCQNCTCAPPSMLGTTLYTVSSQPVCDPNLPEVYSFDVNRFGRFYGLVGRRYTFSMCGETANTQVYITTNTTIPGVIACDDDGCGANNGPSTVSFVPPQSALYRFYVFNGDCAVQYPAGTVMDVLITCTQMTPPPNDLPCNAEALPIGPQCNFMLGTNAAATNSQAQVPGVGAPPSCVGALYQGADLWYSITVPPSGLIGIQTQEPGLCAGAFQLYEQTAGGACATQTYAQLPNGCVINGITGPNSVPATVFDAFAAGMGVGDVVYLRYWERNGNENGIFDICAYEAERPPNDDLCDAIPLPLNTTCVPEQYTFENASPTTGMGNPTCGNTANVNDVWFTFEVPDPLPGNWTGITVGTVQNDNVNLAMAWYRITGACDPANLTQIACQATATINSASPNVPLTPGETIYVRLWGEQPWIGTYDICAVLNQAPANDEPCGAIALPLEYGCLMSTFSNSSATNTVNTTTWNINPINPTCPGGQTANNDVWFTVTVPPNGTVQLTTTSGGMTNAAMAVYSSSGGCAGNNLNLNQIACNLGGNGMPGLTTINGQPPGSTLYIRIWRTSGANGTFGICAQRTDPPPGNCFYTLTMNDSGGDGWGGSYVTMCVGGVCNDYTVVGSSASISVGANVGQLFTVSYTAVGGQQAQNSYTILQYGQPVYVSGTTPDEGMVINETVACDPPPAPTGDCMGALSVCGSTNFSPGIYQPGALNNELNSGNSGCMNGESMGVWMILHFGPNTVPCSPAAFDVVNVPGTGNPNIFDFVMWGPFNDDANAGNICPINQPPYRCNWASLSTPPNVKGLAYNNALPPTQWGGGGPMAKHMVVNPGDRFMLFVNHWAGWNPNTSQQFEIVWKPVPAGFQVLPSDCVANDWTDGTPTPAPTGTSGVDGLDCYPLPIELLTLTAMPANGAVDVLWSTATESGSSHFVVERSADGERFEQIGTVSAAGHSQQTLDYAFVDDAPLDGLSYYRLQMVDVNATTKASDMVPVLMKNGMQLEVFPNPANETLWLSFASKREGKLHWRISDASGRRVREASEAGNEGRNLIELSIADLDQGSYLVEVIHEDGTSIGISRFVKQ